MTRFSRDPDHDFTTLVELFEDGARLIACDGYILLAGWAPLDPDGPPAPGIDESPELSVVAIDAHGRGKGLMGHLRKLVAASEESGVHVTATLSVGAPPLDPAHTLPLDGMDQRALIIEHPGHEELALPLFEGDYPRWQEILATHEAMAVEAITLNPEIIGRLSKLGRIFPGEFLHWRFGGPGGAALVEIGPIFGAAMPVRNTDDEGGQP